MSEPQADETEAETEPITPPPAWINLVLFLATVGTVFYVAQGYWKEPAWTFAVPLLAILVAHESGHYIAARLHGIPASLPFFIPLPVPPFGTMGAVIIAPDRVRTRNALLDFGAAGPLAGMVVAVPLLAYGLSLSEVLPRDETQPYVQEGQSLLYWAMKWLVHGHIPDHMDVYLHPTAMAAWGGLLITFINMLPFGQLDGGHVAYALLGQRVNRLSRWILLGPWLLLVYNALEFLFPVVRRGLADGFDKLPQAAWMPVTSALAPWAMWGVLLLLLYRWGFSEHPPVDEGQLSLARKLVAIATLALFPLLFMPSPLVAH